MRMNSSIIYREFYQDLKNTFGREETDILWVLSDEVLENLRKRFFLF